MLRLDGGASFIVGVCDRRRWFSVDMPGRGLSQA
jgi:hypothetical protein